MTFKEKESYLAKTRYALKDVMALAECRSTAAYELMKRARRNGGAIKGHDKFITAESLWIELGTTIEKEIKKNAVALGRDE